MEKEKKIGFKTGIISGFFGSGGGSYLVPKLEEDINLSCKESHATSIAIILPTCILSIMIYLTKIDINIYNTICISIGGIIGAILGGKLLCKIESRLLKKLFSLILIVIGMRLII